MVQVVFRLDSQECPTMAVGARAIMARLASSVACEKCAAIPCLAAIFAYAFICKICKIRDADVPAPGSFESWPAK